MTTLDRLKPGQAGTVRGMSSDDPLLAQRMLELGLIEGTTVRVVRFAPAGDPMEVELMGYALSLRKHEAKAIEVELQEISE